MSSGDHSAIGNLTDPVQNYLEWNDRIFERYFPISQNDPVRILSFDASDVRALAAEMGHREDSFIAVVRSLVREGASDPFSWWWSVVRDRLSHRDPPPYVGLLALFSLAASQSGDAVDDGPRAFFHRRLAGLLAFNNNEYVPGFRQATAFYGVLEEYLRIKCDGERGRLLLASTSFGGKYVWRARIQVLLNASSRRQLKTYFSARCSHLGELRKDDLKRLLLSELEGEPDYAFSNALRRTLELVQGEESQLLEGFIDLVETEYVRWFLERPEEPRRAPDPVPRSSSPEFRPVAKRSNSPIIRAVTEHVSARAASIRRSIEERRLVLRSQLGNEPWQLWVQFRTAGAQWQNSATASLSFASGSIAFERSDGTLGSLALDDPTTFTNDGNGWAATNQLKAGDTCAVLCSRTEAEALKLEFLRLQGTEPVIRGCMGAPDAAILTAQVPRAMSQEIPVGLRGLLQGDEAQIRFRRGLRIGREYFAPAPPMVFYDHSTIETAHISIDGQNLPRNISRRQNYRLPEELALGKHVVEILGASKSFFLTAKLVSANTDPFDCAGFEVCQARGIARSVVSPGGSATGDYKGAKVSIVIGALIL